MGDPLVELLQNLNAQTPYQEGALDVLRLLGLAAEGNAGASGKVAQMVLDVLGAHLADGVSVGLDWESLDGPAPRGVDFIRAIESARLRNVKDPTPARIVQASQSIFKRTDANGDSYLMQYDEHARRYQPVGGKKEPEEDDPVTTLRREIAEELNLPAPPGEDQCVLKPIDKIWVESTLSATYGLLTRYTFHFFHVAAIRFQLALDSETHWISKDEIIGGKAKDGRAITPIYVEALGFELLDGLPATDFTPPR